jgi:hypothetical protein
MERYIVLIGDIENSRDLKPEKRNEVQNNLASLFDRLNRKSRSLTSPYTITLGDEFQAVYSSAESLFPDIWTVMAEIHPVLARISIGTGTITTDINRNQSLGMDGPAFHMARENIDRMRDASELISLKSENDTLNRLFNSAFRILTGNLRSWNRNRFAILSQLCYDIPVKQIAAELGLSEVAVYKNIRAGTLDAVIDFTDSLSEQINLTLRR